MRIFPSLALFIVLCSPPAALAYKPAYPKTYTAKKADDKFLLVMYFKYDDWRDRDCALLAHYPESGLYKNDDSKQLLWTVGFFEFERNLELASDGVHLIRLGGPRYGISEKELKHEAVAFLANGDLVRTYSVADLLRNPEACLPSNRGGFTLIGGPNVHWLKEKKLDEANHHYTITTWDRQRIVFDIATGEIVARSTEPRLNRAQFYVAIVGVLAIAGVSYRWWVSFRRKRCAP